MGFVLKIYFLGLIAFVPSSDQEQMTVLMVDASRGFTSADGSRFPAHFPVLLANAYACAPDCKSEVSDLGPHLYVKAAKQDPKVLIPASLNPAQSLSDLVGGGGAWAIRGLNISFGHCAEAGRAATAPLELAGGRPAEAQDSGKLAPVPGAPSDRADFSWVLDLSKAVPAAGTIDPDCLAAKPTRCPIAGRLTLNEGTFKTHKLSEFYPASGGGGIAQYALVPAGKGVPAGAYTQAIADWTEVEIRVPTCALTLTLQPFDGKSEPREFTLIPSKCDGQEEMELAVFDLPDPSQFGPADAHAHDEPTAAAANGSHFEIFYDLASQRPPADSRPIPRATGTFVPPASVGQQKESSFLLSAYGVSRAGTASRPICGQVVFAPQ